MDHTDEGWMQQAVDLARHRVGLTGENPSVGCVIVRAGDLVAAAVTGEGGRPHAEEQALEAAGDQALGATVYVTLEPCGARSQGGRSCAELLAAARVARVVVACEDDSPYASGRGRQILRSAGIPVQMGVLHGEASDLYEDYEP